MYVSSRLTDGMPIRWGATASYRWIIASRACGATVHVSRSTRCDDLTGSVNQTLPRRSGNVGWPGTGRESAAPLNETTGGARQMGPFDDGSAAPSSVFVARKEQDSGHLISRGGEGADFRGFLNFEKLSKARATRSGVGPSRPATTRGPRSRSADRSRHRHSSRSLSGSGSKCESRQESRTRRCRRR